MMYSDHDKAWRDFRIGFFTLIAIFLLVMGITFAGGDKGLLFQKTVATKALLKDVGGLKKGCSVTMAGMIIGKVTDIQLVDHLEGPKVEVTMEVRSDIREKIKADATAAIRTQGMLGDRYIDIKMGEASETLKPDKVLHGQDISDFDTTLQETSKVMTEAKKVLVATNEQRGTVGNLFYDQQLYSGMTEITNQLNELIADFKKNPKRYVKLSIF